jgi:hypothetical protein
MNFIKLQVFIKFPYIQLCNLKLYSGEYRTFHLKYFFVVAQFASPTTLLPGATAPLALA